MFKSLKLLILIIFLFSYSNYLYANEKIVFIDIEYIYANSTVGKKINSEIEKKTKDLENQFNKNKKTVDDSKDKLSKQKNVLSEEEFKKKIKELENNIKSLNSSISQKNNEIIKFKQNAKNKFLIELNKILQNYATQNSINLIINKDNILLGKNNLDVTKAILSILDKEVKTIKIN